MQRRKKNFVDQKNRELQQVRHLSRMSLPSRSKYGKRHGRDNSGPPNSSSEPWEVAGIYGGKFHARTLFSKDERLCFSRVVNENRYILTATQISLKVFSASTGQFSHSINCVTDGFRITDFILHPSNEFRVVIASTDNYLRIYDWTDGLLITVRIWPSLALRVLMCRTRV